MSTKKRAFTLRMDDVTFDKIGKLAIAEHRSITNYIEYVLLEHIRLIEEKNGPIDVEK